MGSKDDTLISDSGIIFSDKLYAILSEGKENVLYSPIGIRDILFLMHREPSEATDITEKMPYILDVKLTSENYKKMMEKIITVANLKLYIANKIFFHQHCILKEEFNFINRDQTSFETEGINLSENVAAAEKINSWVGSKTNKKITEVISPDDFNGSTNLILLNAIYFEGEWLDMFDPSKTTKEDFYISEMEAVECEMMHTNKYVKYAEDYEIFANIVCLPYKDERFNLFVILPMTWMGIEDLEKKFKTKYLTEWNEYYLSDTYIFLSLPRFKIEATVDLNTPLNQLGLNVMSSETSGFSSVLNSGSAKVSKIIQKVSFEINELGTETVDVSKGLLKNLVTEPPEFKANQPFLFCLTFNHDNVLFPIFVGKFTGVQ